MNFRSRIPAALRRRAGAAVLTLLGTTTVRADCDFSPLDTAMQELLQTTGLSGGAVLVGRRDGVLHEQYFGDYTADTVVAIASATKLLSATRIAQLSARGTLALDAPVSSVLPQFTGTKGQMTLRQMFSHTAGYGDDEDSPVLRTNQPSLAAAVDTVACCVAMPNGWTPGAQFAYGGISMHVGGRMAEVATGQDWQQGWNAAIGVPLGITTIDWQGLGATSNYRISGGARSNLRDYGRLLQMLVNDGVGNGRRVLDIAALPPLFADNVGGLPIAYAPPSAPPPGQLRYALGNWIESLPDANGLATHSSLGAFGFFPWIDRPRGLYGVFMIRGGANINATARPVYLQMLGEARALVDGGACVTVEISDAILRDGFD
ncbi:MAG TPA: serine hydrolase domain-containing protein [Tahibacter sp.]|uniref:serine hydrolase domain-containing protein n=1 Tax=Tahibacter sp. TaxID=2056211 RepID=UPI002CD1927A|nr:serine hydrolase domain-containing protein [Tahibacter sp.]HSX62943.1 serine hydrolase domain-containing protein [Tahibacter sp.]